MQLVTLLYLNLYQCLAFPQPTTITDPRPPHGLGFQSIDLLFIRTLGHDVSSKARKAHTKNMTASTSTSFPKSAKSWQETINSLSLREAIHFSYVSNEVHKERFVPKDCFDLLQGKVEEYIKTELPQIKVGADGDTNLNDIVDFILNDALKVFMILVMLRIPDRIVGFHKHNFRDAFLPIQCSRNDSSEPLSIKTFTDNTGSFNSAKEVFVDQEEAWSKGVADIDEFCDLQWSFLAETITSRIYDNDKPWPAKSIIPLVKTFGRKTGGYSEVWKIQLHSAHLDIAQEVWLQSFSFTITQI